MTSRDPEWSDRDISWP